MLSRPLLYSKHILNMATQRAITHSPQAGSRFSSSSSPSNGNPQGLPAPGEGTPITLDVSGEGSTVKLSSIGPLVVNVDGTVSRISNWAEMTDVERETTLRLVGKRNKQRLEALKKAKAADDTAADGENSK